jgi:hypothetical protein
MPLEPISLFGNVYLNPLDENINRVAYQHNFLNLKSAEPSLGIPSTNTYADLNKKYYFPIAAIASTYGESRRFSNKNDSLVYYNDNIGISNSKPTEKLTITGSLSATGKLIIGTEHSNITNTSSILGGNNNTVSGEYSSIVGGTSNVVESDYSYIGAGFLNCVNGINSFVIGGTQNYISGTASNINGGANNTISTASSNINGGNFNVICLLADCSLIAGGSSNIICKPYSNINGGFLNEIRGSYSNINGGSCNIVSANFASIGSGAQNTASGYYGGVITGGSENTVRCSSSVINGGRGNTVSGYYSVINSGYVNEVNSNQSIINSGYNNFINKFADYSVIAAGCGNSINICSPFSTILNGFSNIISLSSCYGSIINGCNHSLNSDYSIINSGICNIISGGQHSAILSGECNRLLNTNNSQILGSNIVVSGINDTTFVQNLSVLDYITSPTKFKDNVFIEKNLLVYGAISALSGLNAIATSVTTASSLRLENYGIGPALYVFQDLNQTISEFVSNQNTKVLFIGNTPINPLDGTTGKVGINTDTPNYELSVNGSISATNVIYASGGNSDQWNRALLKSVTAIGDNITKTFEYYHNFNTKDVFVQVYDSNTFNLVYPLINLTNLNYITISFANPPTTNQYTVIVKP